MHKYWTTAVIVVLAVIVISQTGLLAQSPGGGLGPMRMGLRAQRFAGQTCPCCEPGVRGMRYGRGRFGPGMGPMAGGRYNPQLRIEHLTSELGLNQDQKTKVDAILQDEQKQMSDLRGQSSLSAADWRAKFWAIRDTTHDRIRAALTEEQQKTFDSLHAQMGNRPQAVR